MTNILQLSFSLIRACQFPLHSRLRTLSLIQAKGGGYRGTSNTYRHFSICLLANKNAYIHSRNIQEQSIFDIVLEAFVPPQQLRWDPGEQKCIVLIKSQSWDSQTCHLSDKAIWRGENKSGSKKKTQTNKKKTTDPCFSFRLQSKNYLNLLGCSGWLPGCCYVDPRSLWYPGPILYMACHPPSMWISFYCVVTSLMWIIAVRYRVSMLSRCSVQTDIDYVFGGRRSLGHCTVGFYKVCLLLNALTLNWWAAKLAVAFENQIVNEMYCQLKQYAILFCRAIVKMTFEKKSICTVHN